MKIEQEPYQAEVLNILPYSKKKIPTTLTEVLTTPETLCGVGALLFIVVGGAIRLTRMSNTSSIESYQTYFDPTTAGQGQRIATTVTGTGCLFAWKKFWGKLPRRIWNFYIEAFLVPSYRQEV